MLTSMISSARASSPREAATSIETYGSGGVPVACAITSASSVSACVVHEAGERLILCRISQQAQHRQADQETIRGIPVSHPERSSERIALRPSQPVKSAEHRQAQLVQPGERQLHFRLHAPATEDAEVGRPIGRILQQGCLTDAGLTAHDQDSAAARARPVQ